MIINFTTASYIDIFYIFQGYRYPEQIFIILIVFLYFSIPVT